MWHATLTVELPLLKQNIGSTTTAPGLLYAAKLTIRDASKLVFAAVYLRNQHLFGL